MIRKMVLSLLRFYKKSISPIGGIGKCCRFNPTCSMYMYEAVERYGVCKGVWLGIKRIARCNPWGDEGDDPVP